jgi:Tfp pilus assembly protein PilX
VRVSETGDEGAMKRLQAIVRDERGITVVVGLIALLTLTALVLAFLSVSAYEPQISRNLVEATNARYIAEAGLEAAYDTLVTNVNWNGLLAGSTCTTGSVLGGQSTALPGLTATSGTYTVRVRNDCQATDSLMTGVTVEANATDGNDHVILTSTGVYGTATRTVSVVVTRVANPLNPGSPPRAKINSALAFPGYESDTRFTGNSFTVDGRNHDLAGNVITGRPMLGISVGPEDQFVPQGGPVMHHEQAVQDSVGAEQQDNIIGVSQLNSDMTTFGNNTIAAGAMTSQAITDFVNAVKGYADITINSTPASPASFNNVGSSCAGNYNATDCWGTSTQPKIVYVNSQMDPTSAFNALKVGGNSSGYGILIVENGDFTVNGTFGWEGLVIVTGGYTGVGINGGGNQTVRGALIANETATNEAPGFFEGIVLGNGKVDYSRAALDKALAMLANKIPGGTGNGPYVKVTMYNFQEQ